MQLFKNSTVLLVGGLLAFAAPMWAQQSQNSANQNQDQSSQAASQPASSATSPNQRAADLLNTVNKSEIDSAKAIQDKTQNQQVKDFAQYLQNQHQQSQDKLQSIASQANINLQTNETMEKQAEQQKDRMDNAQPAQADRMYVRDEVRDHQKAIHELKQLEPKITDTQLKSFVQQSIPELETHLDKAQQLQTQLRSSASGQPASNAGSQHHGHHGNGATSGASGMSGNQGNSQSNGSQGQDNGAQGGQAGGAGAAGGAPQL